MLSFENNQRQQWNGTEKIIYQKGKPLRFDIKINVSPAPRSPLPKAIVRIVLKDSATQQVVFEKTFRQKNVVANTALSFTANAEELFSVPVQTPLTLFAEMRWLSGNSRKEYKAIGSEEVVFAEDYFVKGWGALNEEEKELTDLSMYRSFWNKIWESPVLDKGSRKKLWEIDAAIRYSIFLSPGQTANGLIETKMLQREDDPDSISQKMVGKMKSGIELSLAELNKLLPLWTGETPLDAARLAAVNNPLLAKQFAGEMLYNIKLKGRQGNRGLIWIIPTFKRLPVVLQKVIKTNELGQVTETAEETVRFPVPASARILGLKSKNDQV